MSYACTNHVLKVADSLPHRTHDTCKISHGSCERTAAVKIFLCMLCPFVCHVDSSAESLTAKGGHSHDGFLCPAAGFANIWLCTLPSESPVGEHGQGLRTSKQRCGLLCNPTQGLYVVSCGWVLPHCLIVCMGMCVLLLIPSIVVFAHGVPSNRVSTMGSFEWTQAVCC